MTIERLWSTTDTTVAEGRPRVLAAILAQLEVIGLATYFPQDAAERQHNNIKVPGTALLPLIPAQYHAVVGADRLLIDTSDGLLSYTTGEGEDAETVYTGY